MKRNSSRTNPKRSLGGFTLVELIVVIAILAILAGVGAVAYNGYIEYTHKGLDRQTVGEVMHAIELADYADPSLFGENGGAMIALTNNGVKVAGGLEGSDIEGAMEDALGELSSVKLSYDKWSGTVDPTTLSQLASISSISAYFDEVKNSGKTASYSNNIEEMWETVKNVTSGIIGEDNDYIAQTIEAYGDLDAEGQKNIKNQWANTITESGAKSHAIIAARNYSFYSYALQQSDCTATMREELEKWKTSNNSMDFIIMSFDGTAAKSNYLKDSNWGTIANRYKTDQASIDAAAFFGILDAAELAGKDLAGTSSGGRPTDEAYREAMSAYTGMVSNVLSGRVKLEAITNLATTISGEKNVIIVNANKTNGVLSLSVSPEDANPREGNNTNVDNTPDIKYITQVYASFSGKGSNRKTVVSPNVDGSGTITTIDLSTTAPNNACTVTPSSDYFTSVSLEVVDGQEFVSTSGNTITASAAGTATVKITGTEDGGETCEGTVTVIVH